MVRCSIKQENCVVCQPQLSPSSNRQSRLRNINIIWVFVLAWQRQKYTLPSVSRAVSMAIRGLISLLWIEFEEPTAHHFLLLKFVSLSQVSSTLMILLFSLKRLIIFSEYCCLRTKHLSELDWIPSFLNLLNLRPSLLLRAYLTCCRLTFSSFSFFIFIWIFLAFQIDFL